MHEFCSGHLWSKHQPLSHTEWLSTDIDLDGPIVEMSRGWEDQWVNLWSHLCKYFWVLGCLIRCTRALHISAIFSLVLRYLASDCFVTTVHTISIFSWLLSPDLPASNSRPFFEHPWCTSLRLCGNFNSYCVPSTNRKALSSTQHLLTIFTSLEQDT
jgi:hypothetical protein